MLRFRTRKCKTKETTQRDNQLAQEPENSAWVGNCNVKSKVKSSRTKCRDANEMPD